MADSESKTESDERKFYGLGNAKKVWEQTKTVLSSVPVDSLIEMLKKIPESAVTKAIVNQTYQIGSYGSSLTHTSIDLLKKIPDSSVTKAIVKQSYQAGAYGSSLTYASIDMLKNIPDSAVTKAIVNQTYQLGSYGSSLTYASIDMIKNIPDSAITKAIVNQTYQLGSYSSACMWQSIEMLKLLQEISVSKNIEIERAPASDFAIALFQKLMLRRNTPLMTIHLDLNVDGVNVKKNFCISTKSLPIVC